VTGLFRPGEPELKPLAPLVAHALTTDLGRLRALQDREGVITFTDPAEGSAAARDALEPERAYAHDQAHGCIRAALDHLVTWRYVMVEARIIPLYGHMSLLRTAHEAALLAQWLMDRAIDDDTRRARGVAVQLEDYDERRKFEDSTGGPRMPLRGKSAAGRIDDLMAAAVRLGLTKTNKKGDGVLTVTVPATVDLFDMYEKVSPGWKGQAIYRLESGYAHAKQWALTQGARQAAPLDAAGRTLARVEASDELAAAFTRRCVNAVERALTACEPSAAAGGVRGGASALQCSRLFHARRQPAGDGALALPLAESEAKPGVQECIGRRTAAVDALLGTSWIGHACVWPRTAYMLLRTGAPPLLLRRPYAVTPRGLYMLRTVTVSSTRTPRPGWTTSPPRACRPASSARRAASAVALTVGMCSSRTAAARVVRTSAVRTQ